MNGQDNIVVLPADLIFAARIRATAEATAVSITIAKDVADFLTRVHESKPRLAILDMDRRGLDIAETVRAVKAEGVNLLAYVSHVQESAIAEAKSAGADRVIPRGTFAKQLQAILTEA